MATANCTLVSQRTSSSSGAWNSYSTNAAYAGYLASSSKYYAYNLQFKTPNYEGLPSKLTFSFGVGMNSSSSGTLRYAICKNDANRNMYTGTMNAVTGDAHQLYSGTFSYSGLTSGVNTITFEVDTSFLAHNTTYYLFIWSYNTTASTYITIYAIDSNNYHNIVFTYDAASSLNYFVVSNTHFDIRFFYENTSAGILSIIGASLKPKSGYTGEWYPKGTIKVNDETILTMDYTHPATHQFAILSTSTWCNMRVLQDNEHDGTPLPVSNTTPITSNSATITVTGLQVYRESDARASSFSEVTTTVSITPYNPAGYIYIDNGTSFDKYEVYIDNGSSWDRYAIYIDNGTSWEQYG